MPSETRTSSFFRSRAKCASPLGEAEAPLHLKDPPTRFPPAGREAPPFAQLVKREKERMIGVEKKKKPKQLFSARTREISSTLPRNSLSLSPIFFAFPFPPPTFFFNNPRVGEKKCTNDDNVKILQAFFFPFIFSSCFVLFVDLLQRRRRPPPPLLLPPRPPRTSRFPSARCFPEEGKSRRASAPSPGEGRVRDCIGGGSAMREREGKSLRGALFLRFNSPPSLTKAAAARSQP